jgi:ribosomal protein S12 methylthiotransferase
MDILQIVKFKAVKNMMNASAQRQNSRVSSQASKQQDEGVDNMSKICMVSLGCSKNLVDSEKILASLAVEGHEFVATPEEADIIIVNTCCFIDSATEESVDMIREMCELKKGTDKKLFVSGCMLQRYGNEVGDLFPEIDSFIQPGDSIDRLLATPPGVAYLKIAEGCDNRCTYCIIPAIKGNYVSRPKDEILAEAKHLAARGIRELIIIAQDTTAYRYEGQHLSDLLKELCKVDGIEWIRLHYCYPEKVTDNLIEVMRSEPKICKYIDIPIQHCNDDILKRMGRRTNKEQITEMISKLREAMPDIAIRTSLIVGFPGETHEQFEELCEFVKTMRFDRLGCFEFSPQEGTLAAEMDEQVPDEIKRERFEAVMLIQEIIAQDLGEGRIGRVEQVIIESQTDDGYMGRTASDSLDIDGQVFVHGEKKLMAGDMVVVKIVASVGHDLVGEIV